MATMGTTITGVEFKKIYDCSEFCNLSYRYESLKNGLNVNKKNKMCFIEKKNIGLWIYKDNKFMYWIRDIDIPDDAMITADVDIFTSDKLILSDKEEIYKKDDLFKNMIQQNGIALYYTTLLDKSQTYFLCKLAVSTTPAALKYVIDQNDAICKLAIEKDPFTLRYIVCQTDAICELAVSIDGFALQCVKKQTEKICKIAVVNAGLALRYVILKTEEICLCAIKNDPSSLKYIRIDLHTLDFYKQAYDVNPLSFYFMEYRYRFYFINLKIIDALQHMRENPINSHLDKNMLNNDNKPNNNKPNVNKPIIKFTIPDMNGLASKLKKDPNNKYSNMIGSIA